MALTVCILAIYLKDGMIADFVDNSTATVTDMAYINLKGEAIRTGKGSTSKKSHKSSS